MHEQVFRATVAEDGPHAYIPIPFDPDEAWGAKARHHVRGSVNGIPWRGPLDRGGACYHMSLGPAWRRDAGTAVGDSVDVILAPEGPLSANVATDVAEALASDADAVAFFDSLPTFYRNNYMRWIDAAKRPPTRATRIREMVELLRAGKRQR